MQSNWPIAAAEKAAEAVLLISACETSAWACMHTWPADSCRDTVVPTTISEHVVPLQRVTPGQDMIDTAIGQIYPQACRVSRLALPRLPRHCKLRHLNCQQSAVSSRQLLTSSHVQGKLLLRELKLLRHFRGHENVICIKDIMENPLGQSKFKVLSLIFDNIKT